MIREFDVITASRPKVVDTPFADTIERQDRGLLKRAREEGARGMALVVIGKDNRGGFVKACAEWSGRYAACPSARRQRHRKAAEPTGGEGEIGLDEALELPIGFS